VNYYSLYRGISVIFNGADNDEQHSNEWRSK
jgi:hypothetical protein